jgi:hypothetical protein
VIICCDADDAGERAAAAAAARWTAEGRDVRVARPTRRETDFADMFSGRIARISGAAA